KRRPTAPPKLDRGTWHQAAGGAKDSALAGGLEQAGVQRHATAVALQLDGSYHAVGVELLAAVYREYLALQPAMAVPGFAEVADQHFHEERHQVVAFDQAVLVAIALNAVAAVDIVLPLALAPGAAKAHHPAFLW